MNSNAVPIAKLPAKLYARAKLEWEAEIFPFAGSVVSGGKAGRKVDVIAEEKIKVNSDVAIDRTSRCGHETHQRSELQIAIGRFETFQVELVLHLKFKGPVFFPIKVESPAGKREKIGRTSS